MQIGQFNHVILPQPANLPPAGNATPESTPESAAAVTAAAPGVASAILNLQSEGDVAAAAGTLPADLVYSNGSDPKAASSKDTDVDTARMAEQHRLAQQRSSGVAARLSVDKDGVLVAQSGASISTKREEFVHHAVNTMRSYADAQARSTPAATADSAASPGSLIARSLGDVQKLAARFKMFT